VENRERTVPSEYTRDGLDQRSVVWNAHHAPHRVAVQIAVRCQKDISIESVAVKKEATRVPVMIRIPARAFLFE